MNSCGELTRNPHWITTHIWWISSCGISQWSFWGLPRHHKVVARHELHARCDLRYRLTCIASALLKRLILIALLCSNLLQLISEDLLSDVVRIWLCFFINWRVVLECLLWHVTKHTKGRLVATPRVAESLNGRLVARHVLSNDDPTVLIRICVALLKCFVSVLSCGRPTSL